MAIPIKITIGIHITINITCTVMQTRLIFRNKAIDITIQPYQFFLAGTGNQFFHNFYFLPC